MRRLAKGSSAQCYDGSGNTGSRLFGRAFVTRGASSDAKGSGASRTCLAVLCLAALVASAFAAPAALGAKKVDSVLGSPTGATGIEGGVFKTPRGVAVNSAGSGGVGAGEVYVVDTENRRIQEFTSAGTFVRAWGMGVNGGTTTTFEVCTVAASCKAGSATATGGGMSAPQGIAIDQATGNVYVSDQSFLRVEEFSAMGTFIRAFGLDVVSTGPGNAPAASAKQIVTLAGASGGTFTLSFRGQTTAPISWSESAANVQAALQALSTVGPGGATVAGLAGGPYTVSFAGGLANTRVEAISADASSLTPGGSTATVTTTVAGSNGFEVCVAADGDVCKTGVTGAIGGAFAGTFSGHLAINPVNSDVLVADPGNRRIQEFTSAGTFVKAFGQDVVANGPGNGGTVNEVQQVNVAGVDGNFTLTFSNQVTSDLPWNAAASQVESALNALSTIGGVGGRVTVTGGPGDATGSTPYLVTFGGAQAGTNVAAIAIGTAGLGTPVGAELSCAGPAFTNPDFQWLRNGAAIPGATSASYVTVGADEGKALQCQTFLSASGSGTAQISSPATAAVVAPFPGTAPPSNTVAPATTIKSGALTVGGAGGAVLGCTAGTWTGSPAFSYQWYLNGLPLSGNGANSGEYTVQAADLAQVGNFQCAVTGANAGGAKMLLTSNRATSPAPAFLSLTATLSAQSSATTVTEGAPGYEVCSAAAGDVCKVGLASTDPGGFAGSSPTRVAVDSTGQIYASDSSNNRVQKFNAGATSATVFAAAALSGSPAPADIAVGAGDHLFVVKQTAAALPFERQIKEFDSAGNLVDTHAVGAGIVASNGLAVDPASGKLYASSSGTPGSRVFVLDDNGALPAPTAAVLSVNTTEHGATFTGTVNPGGTVGLPTSYHFEYSKNGITWTAVAADLNLGEGNDTINVPIAAEGEVSGLEANAFYRVRIVAGKPFAAASTTSGEYPFATDSPAPEVQTAYPQAHTDTTARLTGQLNANNLPTSYRFEYGKTSDYGKAAPVPDGNASDGIAHLVLQEVSGLEPEATYHYRLVATNAEGTSKGEDVAFTTRAQGVADVPGRGFEMLTPPAKPTRAGGKAGGSVFRNATIGLASPNGDHFLWFFNIFPISDDTAFPGDGDRYAIHRTADGWVSKTLLTQRQVPGQVLNNSGSGVSAASADLSTQAWASSLVLQPNAGEGGQHLYTRRDGTGTNGYTGWLANVDAATTPYGLPNPAEDAALINDDGSWMARWGFYRGLLGSTAAEDPSVTQLTGAAGGRTIYLQGNPPEGALELVNGCTGTGAEATQLPQRSDSGTPANPADDTIGALTCEQGSVTSARGAAVGAGEGSSNSVTQLKGRATTAVANDGRRVFFASPDPETVALPASCATGTGASTSCPPQLFVRQRDGNDGEPAVRWISRSRSHSVGENSYDGEMIAGQQIGLFGEGIRFEAASRDGSTVYFRSAAPLTPDDPNGAGVSPPPGGVTTGTASGKSFDVYQYKLPASGDPGDGTLTRISGGPTGTADPSASSTRYVSDDGKRVYLLTTAPIAGADASPPLGGTTVPGGTVGNATTANLYLFDDTKTGAARYKFVAQLPTGSGIEANLATCAASGSAIAGDLGIMGFSADSNAIIPTPANKCFRGTPSGNAVAFGATAQLTDDDKDSAYDIYLYDARTDELTRVSAPPPGVSPYGCNEFQNAQHTSKTFCNADFGFSPSAFDLGRNRGWSGGRGYNLGEDAEGNVSVYFESRLSLVPEDANGNTPTNSNRNYWDVYQWREGKLSLVSPGDSNDDSYYAGNGLDGRDVFFTTTKRIDPRELDLADMDTYDARIGGGFPYTPPATPCDVLAHECRGDVSAAAAPITPASGNAGESRNASESPPPPRCPKGKVRKQGKCVKRKHGSKQHKPKQQGKPKRPTHSKQRGNK